MKHLWIALAACGREDAHEERQRHDGRARLLRTAHRIDGAPLGSKDFYTLTVGRNRGHMVNLTSASG